MRPDYMITVCTNNNEIPFKNQHYDLYYKCAYCAQLFNLFDDHILNCITNYDKDLDKVLSCYSCGNENINEFSKSQLNKRENARCNECVNNGNNLKYAKYDYLYWSHYNTKYKYKHIDDELYCIIFNKEISEETLNLMKKLLNDGGNPNYDRQDTYYHERCEHIYLYNEDGTEFPETTYFQPTSSLKSCIFSFSDCLKSDDDRNLLIKYAKLLIEYGANKENGKKIYEDRYGIPEQQNQPWYSLYSLLI
jgi:hypothetical protein